MRRVVLARELRGRVAIQEAWASWYCERKFDGCGESPGARGAETARNSRQTFTPLCVRKCRPTPGSKPFAENHFRRFKGPSGVSRYGTLALASKSRAEVARSRARQATGMLIRVMEWLDGPGVHTPCELRELTHLSRTDCKPISRF